MSELLRRALLLLGGLLAVACHHDAPTATNEQATITKPASPTTVGPKAGPSIAAHDSKKSGATIETGSTGIDGRAYHGSSPAVPGTPVTHQLASPRYATSTTASPRDIFRYPGVPAASEDVAPPPPREAKPESRLLGTVQGGRFQALFGFRGDVLALEEGDTLEGKYIVRRISPDSVLLEDLIDHSTTSMTIRSAPPSQTSSTGDIAAGTASLSFEPAQIRVEEGLQFAALVIVRPSNPFAACAFEVICDVTFVDVVYVRQGVSVESGFDSSLSLGRLSIKFDIGGRFDGTACQIVFTARAPGSTLIKIENAHVSDQLGTELPAAAEAAVVEITPRERPSQESGEAATDAELTESR